MEKIQRINGKGELGRFGLHKALGTDRKRKISIALYMAAIPLAFVNQWTASRSICHGAGRTSIKGRTIDGELVAKSVADKPSAFNVGDRVFHQKFGNGNVSAIEGNKLTIDFDKAGQKRVLDGFVTGV
ncbi:hypothetical protein [Mesorhizobium sp.]|uniref:hypothetical protein n=1 Tax=Mesorhizobium sp. TaxID=1871066 RepID=UPI002581025F|nr:hypothetical protein [Mesorhizobium sp.]